MGVKGCDRNGCENVMCDRCSNKYGYICSDCFEELHMLLQEIKIKKGLKMQHSDMSIKEFMESKKEEKDSKDLNEVFPFKD